MTKAYMVIGCPGSGKSWVCDQLQDDFEYVHHDLFIGMAGDVYVKEIIKAAKTAKKPLLIEAPFSISAIKEPVELAGIKVIPLFIQEKPGVISDRYRRRENKEIPKGHLTRQETYKHKANSWKAFKGTSEEVYNHLKKLSNEG